MSDLPGRPNLSQLLEAAIDAAGEQVRVALPAVVTSVSSDLTTATVQPAVRRAESDADPTLPDIPLLFPASAGGRLTWPVEAGDPCLLVFCDRSIEEWQSAGGGQEVEPADPRTHDLADAVAIPLGPAGCLSGRSGDISASVAAGAELRLQSDGRVALGNATGELLDLVSQLCSILATPAPGLLSVDPVTHLGGLLPPQVALVTAIQVKLDAMKGGI